MKNARPFRLAGLVAAGVALAVLHACGNAPADDDAAVATAEGHDATATGTAAESADVAALRAYAAGFGDVEAARAAGYTEQITPCWYHRDRGGQGYHIARTEWIDGTVSLLEPELVMYEPLADGGLRFLAVEYIVPFAAWDGAAPPELFGRPFMRNERLELYVMHVWLGKDNPNGLYDDWNPDVSCEHATESEDRA
jgi:hypothetical protein